VIALAPLLMARSADATVHRGERKKAAAIFGQRVCDYELLCQQKKALVGSPGPSEF